MHSLQKVKHQSPQLANETQPMFSNYQT